MRNLWKSLENVDHQIPKPKVRGSNPFGTAKIPIGPIFLLGFGQFTADVG